MKNFSFTVQSDEHVEYFEPLSKKFLRCFKINHPKGMSSPENPGRFCARNFTSLSTCRDMTVCSDLPQTQRERNAVRIEAAVCREERCVTTLRTVDCEQSLFCSKIRAERREKKIETLLAVYKNGCVVDYQRPVSRKSR